MGGGSANAPRPEPSQPFTGPPNIGKGGSREEQPPRSTGGSSGFAALLQGAAPTASGAGAQKPGLANPFLPQSARGGPDVNEQQRQVAIMQQLMQLMPQANAMAAPGAFPPGWPPFMFPGMMPMLMGGLGQTGIPPQMVSTASLFGTF